MSTSCSIWWAGRPAYGRCELCGPGGSSSPYPSGVSAELATAAQQAGKRATGILVEPDGAALTTIARLIDAGAVAAEVDEVFPLADAAEAHRRGETGRTRGKLVLRVAED